MNELAQELNSEERDKLAALLAKDINDLLPTQIDHIKARVMYLTDAEKARFPFLREPEKKITKAPKTDS